MIRPTRTSSLLVSLFIASSGVACSGAEDNNNASTDQDMSAGTTQPDSGGVGGGQDSGQGGDVNCQARCEAKAMECGAPAAQAAQACNMDFCTGSPTESYVSCLESVPCQNIADPNEVRTSCGGTGNTGGDECTCTADPNAAENTFKSCEGSNTGCMTGELCISDQKSGKGSCEVACPSSEEGTQGSCSSGTCNKFKESVPGSGMFFHTCQ